jgi:hypothetical protein
LAPFAPSRGLRQGDPLSPYLFLLVVDGLSVLLKHYVATDRLDGLKVSRRAPGIIHLLFADDSLLLFRANATQATNIKEALTIFERNTGQLLRPSKCSLLIQEGRCEEDVQRVREILGVERIDFDEKYLGFLPLLAGLRGACFSPWRRVFSSE